MTDPPPAPDSSVPGEDTSPQLHLIMARKTVLIVDDEKRMADSLRDLLMDSGYLVQTAYNGAQAIDLLRQKSFHVLVTDLRMQGIDGLDIIRYAHEYHPRTLVIVITGHATTESAIQAVHYNVFDYLRKPFEFDLFRMAIEKAFHKLETDQLREDTAAMITHDIKVPLTSIIGFASMIHDPATGQFHARAAEFAHTIQANGQKILELIENYLTSCRIESGTLKLFPVIVDPRQLVRDVIEVAQLEADRHQRTLESRFTENIPAQIMLDEALVYRAVGNLVQNAIKYSTGRDPIVISMERLAAEDSVLRLETLRICVINDTHEILAEQLALAFDRFARAQSHERFEGSGLGLYVVRAVAEAHRGLARAAWQDDGRICFEMLIPLKVRQELA